ncbi:MAG: D-lactate dehydrogenase [Formosa sp.]|nr:D-lactate dehydrogenase [Formosa sp.]|tara:strand:- start:11944 stop:13638 length:1695 start_codon:yes stop_codon:yes gene_type:complete
MKDSNVNLIKDLIKVIGKKFLITNKWNQQPYCKGWRYGQGDTLAVTLPGTLLEMWDLLEICVSNDLIIIMQGANTGLTGGSTPFGSDYDRPIIIINTIRIKDIHLIKNGKQIIGLAGSTLFDLTKQLEPIGREPHSVIGSTSIGASIIGGICNNSGGSLVQRGPAYTEMALYARVNKNGKLELINQLGINLGLKPREILNNLQSKNYSESDFIKTKNIASDDRYHEIVKDVDSNTPSRFNSDSRLLYGASGSAGKIAVFAVRLDTYEMSKKSQVFYLGSNNPDVFFKIRRDILSKFENLPISGDYLHRDCYDAAKKYSKDTFIVLDKLGTTFLPTLFKLKRKVDFVSAKMRILPNNLSDKLMQFLSNFWPNHLPKKMENFRGLYEHHWIVEMSDHGIDEARIYFDSFFNQNEGDFFECNSKEGDKAILHRFTAASAFGRYSVLNDSKIGGNLSMDIALPRNQKKWFETLPKVIDDKLEMKLYYGHLFCHVLHHNYIVKKNVNIKKLKAELLEYYDSCGAEYPAEHNVGHEYACKTSLLNFYKELDPTNTFNPGIGQTSKRKFWK